MNLYKDKETEYYTNIRHDMISLIPDKPDSKILEIGAGGGDTLMEIKQRKLASEVVGIELNELMGSNQTNSAIDRFIFGNIETMELPLSDNYFDVIICGDILEHLLDPWSAVNKIERVMKSGGLLIASIPNFRHYSVFKKLFVSGVFEYSSYGLFDKTHLRFFCKQDMLKLLSQKNLSVSSAIPIFDLLPNSKVKILNRITLRLFEEFLSLQYVFVVKKIQ